MSNRIKFSFSSINTGKMSAIKAECIANSSKRIKREMKPIVTRYKIKEDASFRDASALLINA